MRRVLVLDLVGYIPERRREMESEPGRQDLLLETHVTEPLCRHTPLGVSNTLQDITTLNSYCYYEDYFLSKIRLLL